MAKGSLILSRRTGFLFLLPTLCFVAFFILFPFVWVFVLSFTNQTLTGVTAVQSKFVGLANYLCLFNLETWMTRGEFGNALRISAQFVFGSAIIGQAGLGLLISWAFHNRKGTLRETVYTLIILAWIIPDVVVAFTWMAFLDRDKGTLNAVLQMLHLARVDWLIEQPVLSIIIYNTWRGTAFSMWPFTCS